MFHTRVVIIGAGQAGLAVSKQLTDAGVDHVILERGRTAERWTSQRWDSLRLLTPNWMSRLPGWSYRGSDPAGFMPAVEVAEYLAGYADSFGAPVVHGAEVRSVRRHRGPLPGRQRRRDAGPPLRLSSPPATAIEPAVPAIAGALHPSVRQITPDRYRNPATFRTAACSSSEPPRPASSSPTNWPAPEGMSCWQSAGTPGCPAATGAWTSCGGWTRWACSTGTLTTAESARRSEPSLQIVGSTDGRDGGPAFAGRAWHQAGGPG